MQIKAPTPRGVGAGGCKRKRKEKADLSCELTLNPFRGLSLRRGLNILWADPNPPEKVAAGKRSKVAGHTAGKSTFCRLLRYALGDVGFGSDSQEAKIVDRFRDGWVVLRVELNGNPWIIGRAFIDKHQRFALPHGDIGEFLRAGVSSESGYQDFEAALHAHFVAPLITAEFPGSKGAIHWRHLIPWFTRDQEARLLSLTTWRAPIGRTHALNTDVDERHFLMRLVLGLLPKGEADEFDRHEKLNDTKRVIEKELPLTQARTEQAFTQLSEWVDVQAKGLEGPLYFDAAKATLEAKTHELNQLRAAVPPEAEVQKLQDVWRQAGATKCASSVVGCRQAPFISSHTTLTQRGKQESPLGNPRAGC